MKKQFHYTNYNYSGDFFSIYEDVWWKKEERNKNVVMGKCITLFIDTATDFSIHILSCKTLDIFNDSWIVVTFLTQISAKLCAMCAMRVSVCVCVACKIYEFSKLISKASEKRLLKSNYDERNNDKQLPTTLEHHFDLLVLYIHRNQSI